MTPLDFADKNRAAATTVLKTTFGMAMAWIGAFISLLYILVTVYNLVPEYPDTVMFAVWLLPMLVWALPAMYAGGRFCGLSLAPRQIWKPLLLITGAYALLISALIVFVPPEHATDEISARILAFVVILALIPSVVLAGFVATNDQRRMRLQFRLTMASIVLLAVCWFALSLALPGAMRESISKIAGEQPYRLYVPDPHSEYKIRQFVGPPDFWTFQSIFTAKRTLQAHMCLYVGPEGSPQKSYHWSFLSGFRFLRNPENRGWC